MKPNMGNIDRIIRAVLGIVLLSLLLVLDGNIRWVGVLGLVMLATATIRFCPLYPVIGLNTCEKK